MTEVDADAEPCPDVSVTIQSQGTFTPTNSVRYISQSSEPYDQVEFDISNLSTVGTHTIELLYTVDGFTYQVTRTFDIEVTEPMLSWSDSIHHCLHLTADTKYCYDGSGANYKVRSSQPGTNA